MQLSKKSSALEQVRHEERLNLGIYIKNRKDLNAYSNSLQPQQLPQQQVNSLIKHLDESIQELQKKAKNTKSEVNETYAIMAELRENEVVSQYVHEKEKAQPNAKKKVKKKEKKKEKEKEKKKKKEKKKEKEKDNESIENVQNEQIKEKRKRVVSEENSNSGESLYKRNKKKKKSEKVEDTESDFENEEELIEDAARNKSDEENSNSGEEIVREEGEEEVYDDSEEYKNKICGKEDPLIVLGSRIKVYWKGDSEWYLGRIICWNEIARQYEVEYDDDDETIYEHLTGPSKENWKYARETKRSSKEQVHFFSLRLSSLLFPSLLFSFLFSLFFS